MSRNFLPISEQDFLQIKKAKSGLLEALFLEEKFDILLGNYSEFEMELLRSSMHELLFKDFTSETFYKDLYIIIRRIINLLSSCRFYLDQCVHHLKSAFDGSSGIATTVQRYKSKEYDSVLGYRVMEALRNYALHRGFPIHACSYHGKTIGDRPNHKLLFAITPTIKVRELEEDGSFKASVLKELQLMGSSIDIKPLMREYISSICRIHEKNRLLLKEQTNDWKNVLLNWVNAFNESAKPETTVSSIIVLEMDSEQEKERVDVPLQNLISRREKLERKNGDLSSLALRYVTSEAIEG